MVISMVGSCWAQKVHNGSDNWTHQETLNSWMIWDPGGCPLPRGQGLSLSGLPDTGFQHDGAHTVDLGCLAKHESFHNLAGGSSLREGPRTGPIEGNAGLSTLRFNETKTIQCKRICKQGWDSRSFYKQVKGNEKYIAKQSNVRKTEQCAEGVKSKLASLSAQSLDVH